MTAVKLKCGMSFTARCSAIGNELVVEFTWGRQDGLWYVMRPWQAQRALENLKAGRTVRTLAGNGLLLPTKKDDGWYHGRAIAYKSDVIKALRAIVAEAKHNEG